MADAAAPEAPPAAAEDVPKLAPVCAPGDSVLDADAVTLESLGYKVRRGPRRAGGAPPTRMQCHMRVLYKPPRRARV
jgi:hypothetical protein